MSTTNATDTKVPYRLPSPRGCSKPLMTHLTTDERKQLETIADREMRSLAAMARLLIVQGMQSYQAQADA